MDDIKLMQLHDKSFDTHNYHNGCFFKNLANIKRLQNQKKQQR
ncbi:MAG: hypothetical protein U9N49_04685 [Campylobacterota bacterium]|nr:hypothetical protein [Campylobacterota bacterium]